MNDPFELRGCDALRSGNSGSVGLSVPFDWALRFSRNWRNPLLWGHYADKHKGICIGLDLHVDPVVINEPRYIETPQELDAAALLEAAARIETPEADAAFPAEPLFAVPPQEVVANPAFREVESAAAALLLTKFEAWRYEDEVRILVKLTEDQREGALYFAELNESSIQPSVVIVGPRCSVTRSEIDAAISGYSTPISVVQAKLSTTSFEVIEDASGFSRD